MRPLLIFMACVLATSTPISQTGAQQKQPRQVVDVIDGDSLTIDNKEIRLWGIDAPELRQTCGDQEAGKVARAFLQHLVDNKPVRCTYKGRDRYGRSLMLCRNHANLDVGQAMVDAGWAWAYAQFTIDYVVNELEARRLRRGVHNMTCEFPWNWRQHQGRGGKPVPPLK